MTALCPIFSNAMTDMFNTKLSTCTVVCFLCDHEIKCVVIHSFIHRCVHCCGLQMSHVCVSFPVLFIGSYRFEPVQSLTAVANPHCLPSIVVSKVS